MNLNNITTALKTGITIYQYEHNYCSLVDHIPDTVFLIQLH